MGQVWNDHSFGAHDPRIPPHHRRGDLEISLFAVFPVIITSSLIFDRGNGLLATILSGLLIIYSLTPPYHSLTAHDPPDFLAFVAFIAVGVFITTIVESLHLAMGNLSLSHAQLETVSREREVVLSELTHRIRNHLATIGSMLRLQAKSLNEPAGSTALLAAADRVQVLARAHERLVVKRESTQVNSQEYLTDLANELGTGLIGLRPISMRLSIERHSIGLQTAVALGLVVNELLTNALKYAFPDGRAGTVQITFRRADTEYHLIVSDNGIGGGNSQLATGLGLRLVRALASQFGGDLEIHDAGVGSTFVVRIPAATASP